MILLVLTLLLANDNTCKRTVFDPKVRHREEQDSTAGEHGRGLLPDDWRRRVLEVHRCVEGFGHPFTHLPS